MAPESEQSLGHRTIRGMLWAYGSYFGGRVLVLVSTAILARLLTPSDFGVVALALVFMTFIETVKDLGLTQALILVAPEDEEARAQTVFMWTVAIGVVLAIGVSIFGQFAAGFFGHASLRGIVPVLGVSFLLESLGATHDSLARKRLDYRTRTFAEGSDVIIRGALGIGLALAGFGAWSLVIGYLVGAAARTTVLWALVPFRPRLRFQGEHLGGLVRFGGALTVVDISSAISHNLDYLFIGRVLGSSALGLYLIGFRLPELLIMNLAIVAGDVLFPAYSELKRGGDLERGFLLSLRFTAALVFPMGIGLAVLARPVVLALFGARWHGSIEVMQILAAYAVLSTLNIPAGTIYKVSGRAWILLVAGTPYLVVLFFVLLAVSHHGILPVAIGVTACQGTGALIAIAIAGRILAVPYRRIARTILGPLVAAVGMGIAVFPIERLIGSPWPALLLGGVVGIVVYAGLTWLLARDIAERMRGLIPGLPSVAPGGGQP